MKFAALRAVRPLVCLAVATGAAVLSLAGAAPAALGGDPKPTAVLPQIADPGDTVRIVGTGLAGVDTVQFTAIVGGFVGVMTLPVAPLSTSDTEVVVQVPLVGAFSPPEATPPGEVVGSVRVVSAGSPSDSLLFGYLEATFGDVTTIGQGGSIPAGFTPRSGLDLTPSMLPVLALSPMLSGAPEGDFAVLAVGLPGTAPYPAFFGGSLYLDPGLAPLLFFPGLTGEHGVATQFLPLPPGPLDVTVAFQWFTLDPAGPVSASDVLNMLL